MTRSALLFSSLFFSFLSLSLSLSLFLPLFVPASISLFLSGRNRKTANTGTKWLTQGQSDLCTARGAKSEPDQRSVTIPESNSIRRRNSIRGRNCPVGTDKIQSLSRRVSLSSRFFSRAFRQMRDIKFERLGGARETRTRSADLKLPSLTFFLSFFPFFSLSFFLSLSIPFKRADSESSSGCF